MQALETYISTLQREAQVGVKETTHYPALKNLLNAIGEPLGVLCVVHTENVGAGIPDAALYAISEMPQNAVQTERAFDNRLLPKHGVIEAKGLKADIKELAKSEQVSRYVNAYGQVLVTNFYQFALVIKGDTDSPRDHFNLTESADEFRKASPRTLASSQGDAFQDFIKRVMLHLAPLSKPRDVANLLALYARAARERVEKAGDQPALQQIRADLENALGIAFEQADGDHFFRSTLVQTLFYGVFSAWVLWHESHPDPQSRFDLWRDTRLLNVPVIRELFHQLTDPHKLKPLALEPLLNWAAETLNRIRRPEFFADFQTGSAVQYFYEPFLEAFDPELRRQLGVWYTPPEVVEYMVSRVDSALRDELGIRDGLADPNVLILDPCCGTGAYLIAVLRRIHATFSRRRSAAEAGQAVQTAMRQRVFGFEILPAPFVVAHLQLGMLLNDFKAPLKADERAGVYLTNALTGWQKSTEPRTKSMFSELEQERTAADAVKQDQPILVILGNPPYSGFAGVAINEERDLTTAYRTTQRAPAPQGQGLNDLYVRFFRMAERRIVEKTGRGIICYISNYSWLDGLSHTGMRERYLDAFDTIFIDNLHGDRIISEYAPDGRTSETVFAMQGHSPGIRIGTAVTTMVRKPNSQQNNKDGQIYYRDFHQARAESRRNALLESLKKPDLHSDYTSITPKPELGFPFKPRIVGENYFAWPKLPDLFPTSFPGVQTKRDEAVVDIDKDRLTQRMKQYFDPAVSHEEMRRISPRAMDTTNQDFNPIATREALQKRGFRPEYILRYCYRPFDMRWIYYEHETNLLQRRSPDYFPHIQMNNIWIEARQRQAMEVFDRGYFTRVLSDNFGNGFSSYFPLYLYDAPCEATLFDAPSPGGQRPNLSPAAQSYLAILHDSDSPRPDANAEGLGVRVESLFYHALAILHAPAYRAEHAGALKQDWPRIPLPAVAQSLTASAGLGRRVAALLDTETPVEGVTEGDPIPAVLGIAELTVVGEGIPNFEINVGWGHFGQGSAVMPGRGRLAVGAQHVAPDGSVSPTYDIYLNDTTYWKNIPEAVWNYTIGGYQVLKKWLSYRETRVLGRSLKPEEASEFINIARRIAALIALQPDLDANYRAVAESTYSW